MLRIPYPFHLVNDKPPECQIGAGLCSRRPRRGVLGESRVRGIAEQGVGRHAHTAPLARGPPPAAPPVPETTLGAGQIKVALILPLSAAGNAGIAGQAMRNAADM